MATTYCPGSAPNALQPRDRRKGTLGEDGADLLQHAPDLGVTWRATCAREGKWLGKGWAESNMLDSRSSGELGSRCRGPGAGLAAELEVPDRLGDDFLPDADHRVGRNVKVHDAAAPDYCISADPAWADDHDPARNPGTHLDDNVPIEGAMRHLALRTRHPEVVGSGQQHDIVSEEDIVTDVHMPAHSIYENITQADRVTDADARDRPAHERPPEKTSDPPVAEAAELVTWNIPFAREAFPEEPGPAPHGGVAACYHHSPPAPGSRMCP